MAKLKINKIYNGDSVKTTVKRESFPKKQY